MRRRVNRGIAFLMTIVMMLSSIDLPVYASGSDTVSEETVIEADAAETEAAASASDDADICEEEQAPDETLSYSCNEDIFSTYGRIGDSEEESEDTDVDDDPFDISDYVSEEAMGSNIPSSYTYGTVTYTYAAGVLTISGTGSASKVFGGYDDKNDIKRVVVEEGITELGVLMFFECTGIEEVIFPESLKTIGTSLFWGCESIKEISIPAGVEEIQNGAFFLMGGLERFVVDDNNTHYCAANGLLLTKDKSEIIAYPAGSKEDTLTIPAGVKKVGTAASAGGSFSKLVFEGDVEYIENVAFASCSNLTDVDIRGIGYIGKGAFGGCNNLKSVSVTSAGSISENSFASCDKLENVIISSAGTVAGNAFKGCVGLKEVDLTVNKLQKNAFIGCTGIEKVTLKGTGEHSTIEAKAFPDVEALKEVSLSDLEYVEGSAFPSGKYDAPYTAYEKITANNIGTLNSGAFYEISGEAVVTLTDVHNIGAGVFSNSEAKSITISGTVATIGGGAFQYCKGLGNVAITGVENINGGVFYSSDIKSVKFTGADEGFVMNSALGNCNELKEAEFVNVKMISGALNTSQSLEKLTVKGVNTEAIIEGSFNYQGALKTIILENIKEIYAHCFTNMSGDLEELQITNVPTIGSAVFTGKVKLKTLKLSGIKTIGDATFNGCAVLEKLELPDGLESIGTSAFGACISLKSVSVPDSVTSLGSAVFYNCTALESVVINGNAVSKTTTGSALFSGCVKLKKAELKNLKITGGGIFSGCNSLNELVVDACDIVGSSTFAGNGSLEKVTIKNMENTGNTTFAGCSSLKTVELTNVKTIGSQSFVSCKSLESITLNGSVELIMSNAFAGDGSLEAPDLTGVKELQGYPFAGCNSITEINIPASLVTMDTSEFSPCGSLTAITVDEENTVFSSDEGILFSKDKKTILQYPAAKEGNSYTVPAGVIVIGTDAFSGNRYLESVTIGRDVAFINKAFVQCSKLIEFRVDAANTNGIKVSDGVLFAGNGNTLIAWPYGRVCDSYTVPDDVTDIAAGAFQYVSRLKRVIIKNAGVTVDKDAFLANYNLTVVIPEDMPWTGPSPRYFSSISCGPDVTIVAADDAKVTVGSDTFYIQGMRVRLASTDPDKRLLSIDLLKKTDHSIKSTVTERGEDGLLEFSMAGHSLDLDNAGFMTLYTADDEKFNVYLNLTTPKKYEKAADHVRCFNDHVDWQVKWSPEPVDGKFLPDTAYTAVVTVSKKGGGDFAAGSVIKCSIDGIHEYDMTPEDGVYSYTYEFDITAPREVVFIEILSQPDRLDYEVGDVFDPTGIELSLTYDDGFTETVRDAEGYNKVGVKDHVFDYVDDDYMLVLGMYMAFIYVRVDKATPALTVSLADRVYEDPVPEPQVTIDPDIMYPQYLFRFKKKGMGDSAYTSMMPFNVGEYTMKVEFIGNANYNSVSATCDFCITRKPVVIDHLDIAGGNVYSGDPIEPAVKAYYSDTLELEDGSYYCVYSNNINAGTASVTVKPTIDGNYIFEDKTENFVIAKADHAEVAMSGFANAGEQGMVDLRAVLTGNAGDITVTDKNDPVIIEEDVLIENGVLKFEFSDTAAVGQKADITIPVTESANYNDYNIDVTATVVDCAHLHTEQKGAKVATCTEKGRGDNTYCTDCHALITAGEETEIDTTNHFYDDGVVTKLATYTETGVRTYTCKRCGHTKTEPIEKLVHVHEMIHFERNEATVTEEGNIEYWMCWLCDRYFSDEDGEHEITKEDTVIPKLEAPDHKHVLIYHARVEATTDAAGNIEYWECTECHKCFSDADGKNVITKESTIIPKIEKKNDDPDPHTDPDTPVNPEVPEIETVTLSENSVSVKIGGTKKLIPVFAPEDAKETIFTWTSSNEKVVTVDKDGMITGVWFGTAKVTVTTSNGKSAVCDVTVLKSFADDSEDKVRISPEDMDSYVVPEKQEHKPATPEPVSVKLKDGTELKVSVSVNYMNAITYTSKAIKPAEDLGVEYELQDILDKAGVTGVAPGDIFKVTFKSKNNKKAGKDTASFYGKISLVKNAKKKFKLTKEQVNALNAILKAVNKELKNNKISYTINKASMADLAEVKLHAKLTKDGKLKLNKKEKISGFKNVKIKFKADDKKAVKLSPKAGYSYSVTDADKCRVKISGNTNFTGYVTVTAEK